jgi:hypothetical protein
MAIAITIYGVTMRSWYFCGERYCKSTVDQHPDYSSCKDGFAVSFSLACADLGCSVLAAIGGFIVVCFVGREEPASDEPPRADPARAPLSMPDPDEPRAAAAAAETSQTRSATRPLEVVVDAEVAHGTCPSDAAGTVAHTWVDRRDPDGRTFYECAETGATRWDRPEAAASYAVAMGVPEAK